MCIRDSVWVVASIDRIAQVTTADNASVYLSRAIDGNMVRDKVKFKGVMQDGTFRIDMSAMRTVLENVERIQYLDKAVMGVDDRFIVQLAHAAEAAQTEASVDDTGEEGENTDRRE